LLQELWPLPSFSDRHRQRQQKAIATRKNGVLHSSNGEKNLQKVQTNCFWFYNVTHNSMKRWRSIRLVPKFQPSLNTHQFKLQSLTKFHFTIWAFSDIYFKITLYNIYYVIPINSSKERSLYHLVPTYTRPLQFTSVAINSRKTVWAKFWFTPMLSHLF
jgi:hypothetical protein